MHIGMDLIGVLNNKSKHSKETSSQMRTLAGSLNVVKSTNVLPTWHINGTGVATVVVVVHAKDIESPKPN